jgi:hypothetical protein
MDGTNDALSRLEEEVRSLKSAVHELTKMLGHSIDATRELKEIMEKAKGESDDG